MAYYVPSTYSTSHGQKEAYYYNYLYLYNIVVLRRLNLYASFHYGLLHLHTEKLVSGFMLFSN